MSPQAPPEVFKSPELSPVIMSLLTFGIAVTLYFGATTGVETDTGRLLLNLLAVAFALGGVYGLIFQPFRYLEVFPHRRVVSVVSGHRFNTSRRDIPYSMIAGVDIKATDDSDPDAAPFMQNKMAYSPRLLLKSGEDVPFGGSVPQAQTAERMRQLLK